VATRQQQPAAQQATDNPRTARTPQNAGTRTPVATNEAPAANAEANAPNIADLRPSWWPLPEAHQKYVDDVLEYWEYSSAKINRYECKFARYNYDPAILPLPPGAKELQPWQYTEGVIKYMAPDKAMYKAEKILRYQRAQQEGEQDGYQELPIEKFGDHWVCDGKSIFEFNHGQKELRQIHLPPEAQGEAISKGPLPFLFRAKKSEILDRFWIRPVTPANVENEYWLEAWPKTQDDAAQFRAVRIIIDRDAYLPKALILMSRTEAYETFHFNDPKVNFSLADHLLGPWRRDFYEPATPKGWQKIVERFEPRQQPQPQ